MRDIFELLKTSEEVSRAARKNLAESRKLIELGRKLIEKTQQCVRTSVVLAAASKLDAPFIKKCVACGKEFTVSEWRQMRYVGWQTGEVSGELRNCKCESTLLFVTNRRENQMELNPGDKIRILCNRQLIEGTVITAVDYGTWGRAGWYVEFERPDGRYGYWKQGVDGGTISKVESGK